MNLSPCRIKREEDRIKRELEEKELQVRSIALGSCVQGIVGMEA